MLNQVSRPGFNARYDWPVDAGLPGPTHHYDANCLLPREGFIGIFPLIRPNVSVHVPRGVIVMLDRLTYIDFASPTPKKLVGIRSEVVS